ncbi:MAG: metN2 [Gammaproteobacteria bacterium]|jgi:putative ABC transport system ATP-binding protein|nr:metN2 [Gammaproteobacteria bacterium]
MTAPLLQFQNVSLSYPALDRPILHHIDYTVDPGDFVIILGANGSGKSSLLKIIDGRYQPTQGHLKLNAKNINTFSAKVRANTIHTLTQHAKDSLFLNLTLFENYQLMQKNVKTPFKPAELSKYLSGFNQNLSTKLAILAGQLSGGEQQALALALAVLEPPAVLLLDEHTSALDPKTGQYLMALTAQVIQERNITAILTTHNVEHALRYGSRILALKEGGIYDKIEEEEKKTLTAVALLERCY